MVLHARNFRHTGENPLPHTTHGMSVISSGMVVVVVVVGVMVRI